MIVKYVQLTDTSSYL